MEAVLDVYPHVEASELFCNVTEVIQERLDEYFSFDLMFC